MEKLDSEGKCCYCDKTITQQGMTKHLESHLKELTADKPKSKCYLIKVDAAEMFLYLLVNQDVNMDGLDAFFRKIWLECCGHMSSFSIGRKQIDMAKKVSSIYKQKLELNYQYDFGSTTALEVHFLGEYSIDQGESIKLLSRNEPLKIMCATCKTKPAVTMCSVCIYDEYSFFCKTCGTKHKKVCSDFADYSAMPVVNSPRMGVCGYEGGSIDLERDGVYKG